MVGSRNGKKWLSMKFWGQKEPGRGGWVEGGASDQDGGEARSRVVREARRRSCSTSWATVRILGFVQSGLSRGCCWLE